MYHAEGPMVVLVGVAVSYERGNPVNSRLAQPLNHNLSALNPEP